MKPHKTVSFLHKAEPDVALTAGCGRIVFFSHNLHLPRLSSLTAVKMALVADTALNHHSLTHSLVEFDWPMTATILADIWT